MTIRSFLSSPTTASATNFSPISKESKRKRRIRKKRAKLVSTRKESEWNDTKISLSLSLCLTVPLSKTNRIWRREIFRRFLKLARNNRERRKKPHLLNGIKSEECVEARSRFDTGGQPSFRQLSKWKNQRVRRLFYSSYSYLYDDDEGSVCCVAFSSFYKSLRHRKKKKKLAAAVQSHNWIEWMLFRMNAVLPLLPDLAFSSSRCKKDKVIDPPLKWDTKKGGTTLYTTNIFPRLMKKRETGGDTWEKKKRWREKKNSDESSPSRSNQGLPIGRIGQNISVYTQRRDSVCVTLCVWMYRRVMSLTFDGRRWE